MINDSATQKLEKGKKLGYPIYQRFFCLEINYYICKF